MNSQPTSSFFRLPLELRNEVYHYLLIFDPAASQPAGMIVQTYSELQSSHIPFQKQPISIFRVCRQLHDETVRIFYEGNRFPIRIDLGGYPAPSASLRLEALYSTPWEILEYYNLSTDSVGVFCPLSHENKIGTPVTDDRIQSSNPYLRLIKHVDIQLNFDASLRFAMHRPSVHKNRSLVLQPFVRRLGMLHPDLRKHVCFSIEGLQPGDTPYARDLRPDQKKSFEYIFHMLWQLLQDDKPALSQFLDSEFPELKQELMQSCELEDVNNGGGADVADLYRDIELEEGSHWAVLDGKLFVQADEALLE